MWQFGWAVGSCWNRTGGRSSHLTDWKLEDLQSVQGCCQNIYRQSCKLHIKYHLTQLQQQLLLAESGWRLRRRYRKRPGACTPAYEMKSCNPCGWFHMQMWLPPERVNTAEASFMWNCVTARVRCGQGEAHTSAGGLSVDFLTTEKPHIHTGVYTQVWQIISCQQWLWKDTVRVAPVWFKLRLRVAFWGPYLVSSVLLPMR